MKRVVVCALVVMSLAGCKSDEKPKATASSTTSTTSVEQGYRQQYLNAVAPPNCALGRIQAAQKASAAGRDEWVESDWPAIQSTVLPAYKASADATIVQFQTLSTARWPANAQDDVRILVRLLTAEASSSSTVAAATSYDDFLTAVSNFTEAVEASEQAAAVRAILGLPTNLVESEHDWCAGPPSAAAVTTTTAKPA